MKTTVLCLIFLIGAASTKLTAQVSNIHGAWIEVNSFTDSMEVRLVMIAKQGSLMPMSQTISMFQISSNGALNSLPAMQVDRIRSTDTANIRYLVFNKKIPLQSTSVLFAWNACCRGSLVNASSAAINESMVAYTTVYQDAFTGIAAESTRITSFPPMNLARGVAQSVQLSWDNPTANITTQTSISVPLGSLSNGQFLAVSGSRLPANHELTLNGNELTIFAPEAGNLAFNIRYQRSTVIDGNTIILSLSEAAFQLQIDQASSLQSAFDIISGEYLEVYDMLGKLVFRSDSENHTQPVLNAGTYLFKRGTSIQKVRIF